jgi:hypothetical protein
MANRPIKRLQPKKPKAPAPLSRVQDMYTPDWDAPNAQLKRVDGRADLQREIERGNPGIVRSD